MTDEDKALSLSALTSEKNYNDMDDMDDEADFNPSDSEGSEDDESQEETFALLNGTLTFNDEGRLVYSGTWAMNTEENLITPIGKESNGLKKKKKKKFKLKSKQVFEANSKKTFNLADPLTVTGKNKRHKQRTMLFDGFFFSPQAGDDGNSHSSKKVKERDVEISFILPSNEDEKQTEKPDTVSSIPKNESFDVKGRGCNEFGTFVIDGTYTVNHTEKTSSSAESPTVTIKCNKRYTFDQSSKKNRRSRYEDDEEDDEYDADEAADFDEIIALNEEAGMSVEDLKKRYLTPGNMSDEPKISPPKKKIKG